MEHTAVKKQAWPIVLFFVLAAAGAIGINLYTGGKFLAPSNLAVLLSHAVVPSFVAWGLAFVFACDFTDMSLGAVIILAANAAGVCGNLWGYPGVVLGGVGVGMLLITLNFFLFITTKVPSWVAGIGLAMIYEAAGVFYSNARADQGLSVVELDGGLRQLAKFPLIYVIFFLGFALAYLLYNRTQVGINIRALGSGLDVARSMGISIGRTLMLVGVITGFFVGCAAFLTESYNARISAQTGLTSLSNIFQPMATLMLARVLQSRINLIVGIPICALCVYSIFNVLTILGIPSGTWQEAVLGAIVILFGVFAQRGEKGVVK